MSTPIQVAFLTKPGCHLCDEMKGVLARAMRGLPVEVREVDISTDPALEERYGQDIPVLFIDGRKAFKHRVSERALRQRLEAAERR
jgi:glutaredoxin